jgi:hypothetical protein
MIHGNAADMISESVAKALACESGLKLKILE